MPRTSRKTRKKQAQKKQVASAKQASKMSHETAKVPEDSPNTSRRLFKRSKHTSSRLPNSFKLTKQAFAHVWRYKKLFAIIALVYLILNLVLVRGFLFTADIGDIKSAISELFSGSVGQIAGSLTVMSLLVGSLGPASDVAGLYQSLLTLMFSLFIIWTLRQTYAGELPRIRDVFYKSTYPLIQFVLVILIVGLQLIPLLLANFVYSATVVSGITTTSAEKLAVIVTVFLLVLWCLYMISVSIFAMYIVTLPDMTPLKALRSAKGLVHHRRWAVMRKLLFLPVALSVIGLAVMIPIILVATGISEVIFLVMSAFILPLIHSYIYSLYRELLA